MEISIKETFRICFLHCMHIIVIAFLRFVKCPLNSNTSSQAVSIWVASLGLPVRHFEAFLVKQEDDLLLLTLAFCKQSACLLLFFFYLLISFFLKLIWPNSDTQTQIAQMTFSTWSLTLGRLMRLEDFYLKIFLQSSFSAYLITH